MAIIVEVEHILNRRTPEAFASYEKHYGEISIPVTRDAGYDILGAWRQVTGDVARDFMLMGFDSLAACEAAGAKLAASMSSLSKLGEAFAEARLELEEVTNFGSVLPVAEGRRAVGQRAQEEQPRRYCLVRRDISMAKLGPAIGALAELATAQDTHGKARLFTAYLTMTDRLLTEVWVFDEPGFDPYAGAASAVLAPLDDLTSRVSTVLLEPFSYSEAR